MSAKTCPDCGVNPGELHIRGCDVERCPDCGGQLLFDDCADPPGLIHPRQPWTGEWPGFAECREFGWFCKFVPGQGWQECAPDDRDARPDLIRLHGVGVWDAKAGRFRRRTTFERSRTA
jgi:hypothetical protein